MEARQRTEKKKAKEKERQTDKLPGNSAAADNKNSQEPRASRFRGPVVQPDSLKDKNPEKGSDSDEEWYVVEQVIKRRGKGPQTRSKSRLTTLNKYFDGLNRRIWAPCGRKSIIANKLLRYGLKRRQGSKICQSGRTIVLSKTLKQEWNIQNALQFWVHSILFHRPLSIRVNIKLCE